MRSLLLSVSFLLLAVPVLLRAAPALAEPGERLLCHDLDELAFHEELSPGATAREDYSAALRSNWLGVPYAVGPALRIPGHGVTEILVVPIKTWRPEDRRIVLPVQERSFPAQTELDSGVMVTFRFTPLDEEEVKTSLEDLMERDPQPKVGPDFVVMVGGTPLAGSALSPLLPLDRIAVPILDRTAWEVATYLSVVLDCERQRS
jgi:hypothetical protein